MIAYYPIVVGAALVGWIGLWVVLALVGLPKLASAPDLLCAAARNAAALLRRLAAVVRRGGLRPHPAGRRIAPARAAPQRPVPDHAALAVAIVFRSEATPSRGSI
jgi:hypothetical protein